MAYENGGCSESCEIYETEEASGVRRAAVQKYRAREV
jgi:hypothetical protein